MVQSVALGGERSDGLMALHAWVRQSWVPSWSAIAGAVLLGLAQALSIATPWNGQPLWWLQVLSLAGLVVLLQRSVSVKHAALLAWLFALAWLSGTFWWLFISMHVYGGLAAPLAVLAVLALAGFLGLYYAAAAAFFKAYSPPAGVNIAWAAIIFAAAWLLAELARNAWFTGFPWGAGGYAHVDGVARTLAPYIGVYGVGALASGVGAYIALSICAHDYARRRLVVALVALLFTLFSFLPATGAGSKEAQPAPTNIALLQGNIPQGEKFDNRKGVPEALDWYAQELVRSTATLVVAPETAIPLLPSQLPDDYWRPLQQRFASGPNATLVGIPLGSFDEGYTNSVIGLKPGSSDAKTGYRYHKHHLVPFGEFIPPLFKWFTRLMNIPLGDFNRGAVGQASFEWAGQRWGPNVCYEDLFGDELAARFINPATAPTVMVNVSNIAWFGNTVAIDQHLHISRMRALELARPMARATNTGATVVIDHQGQVTHSLPRHTRGVLVAEVRGRNGTTPFAWWAARWGLWPLWGLGLAVVLCAGVAARYKPSANSH
jgi:apolipoprotein N-acyltransferase